MKSTRRPSRNQLESKWKRQPRFFRCHRAHLALIDASSRSLSWLLLFSPACTSTTYLNISVVVSDGEIAFIFQPLTSGRQQMLQSKWHFNGRFYCQYVLQYDWLQFRIRTLYGTSGKWTTGDGIFFLFHGFSLFQIPLCSASIRKSIIKNCETELKWNS